MKSIVRLRTVLPTVIAAAMAVSGCGASESATAPVSTQQIAVSATAPTATASRPVTSAGALAPSSESVRSADTKTPATPSVAPATRWLPRGKLSWQIQYSGALNLNVPAQVYNLDWESTTAAQVAQLKRRGVRTVCYINAGAFEDWRADRAAIPAALRGRPLDGWPGERWLDVRQRAVLLPVMARRMDVCRAKGFDAVDPDNMDGWANGSGFPLRQADSLNYLRDLATAAHARRLSIGLKNALELIPQAVSTVDFAVNESCEQYRECRQYAPLLQAGKTVFHVEYDRPLFLVCALRPAGFSTIVKDLQLGARRQACR